MLTTIHLPPASRETRRSRLIALSVDPQANRSYDTLIRRWPVILTSIIDHLHRAGHDLATQSNDLSPTIVEERVAAGTEIIQKIGKLKYEMARDKPLLCVPIYRPFIVSAGPRLNYPLPDRPIVDDGEPSINLYNQELAALEARGKGTWFTAPWLYAE